MASDAQTAANIENAKKSTGPNTADGKAKSSKNSYKHGLYSKAEIIDTENPADHELLVAEYYRDFTPVNAVERDLVDMLIDSAWQSRRQRTIGAAIWNNRFYFHGVEAMGAIFIDKADAFCRADRCKNAAQRHYQKALKQLMDARAMRGEKTMPVLDEQPTESEPLNTELASFRSFPSQAIAA